MVLPLLSRPITRHEPLTLVFRLVLVVGVGRRVPRTWALTGAVAATPAKVRANMTAFIERSSGKKALRQKLLPERSEKSSGYLFLPLLYAFICFSSAFSCFLMAFCCSFCAFRHCLSLSLA